MPLCTANSSYMMLRALLPGITSWLAMLSPGHFVPPGYVSLKVAEPRSASDASSARMSAMPRCKCKNTRNSAATYHVKTKKVMDSELWNVKELLYVF